MYDIFKKHIIRNEKYLLQILNKSKRFKIDDKYINTDINLFKPDNFKLPNEVTYLEFKTFILIAIDQFRNQVGYDKSRKLILVTKIKKHDTTDSSLPTFIPPINDKDNPSLLEGNIILPRLLGHYENFYDIMYPDEKTGDLIDFCVSNNAYLKWGFHTDWNTSLSILDNIFYVFSKKNSIRLEAENYDSDYRDKYMFPIASQILITLYKSVTYHNFKLKQLETGGQE